MEELDCVVIGGGVIGLAIARRIALAGHEVVVLEAEESLAMHTSSRNSEVIHAGLYYPTGSLKARACVEGRHRLYAYCEKRGVPHRRIGKVLVACDNAEIDRLREIEQRARANGVEDLYWLTAREVVEREPAVRCVAGLVSPSTGIVDSHAFIGALEADLSAAGGTVLCRSRVEAVEVTGDGFALRVRGAEGHAAFCRTLVNAAGLESPAVARSITGFPAELVPERHLAKGHYFVLRGRSPFRQLIYPVPVNGGLGVHVTLDLEGRARFGPDVAWVATVDYSFDESRKDAFVRAIQRYWPEIEANDLVPGYTGIRPKLGGAGTPATDFVVQGPAAHGLTGLVNLFGIESPGLTASLALADQACEQIGTVLE